MSVQAAAPFGTNWNLMSVTSGSTDVFAVRGDGLTTVFGNMIVGTSVSDKVTISSTIQGATPFVLEGGK